MGPRAIGPFQSLSLGAQEDILSSSKASGDPTLRSSISAQIWPLGFRACPADGEADHCYPPVRGALLLEALGGQQLTSLC